MRHLAWTNALLGFAPLVFGQSSSSSSNGADGLTTTGGSKTVSYATATINGTPTRYSVAFTVPAEADIGPNLLPNIYDSHAKNAQVECPGYKASNVKKTSTGFTASLSLAGDPVGQRRLEHKVTKLIRLVQCLRHRYPRALI